MNEEVQRLIDELTAAGATDEEIVEIINQRTPTISVPVQQAPPPEQTSWLGNFFDTNRKNAAAVTRPFSEDPIGTAGLVAETFDRTLLSTPQKMLGAVDELFNSYIYKPLGISSGDYTSPLTRSGQATEEFLTGTASPELRNSLTGQVASGLGTGLAMMGTGGAGLIGRTAAASPSVLQTVGRTLTNPATVLGGSMTAVPEYEAAKAAGVPDDELFGVLMKNYLVGQTEALPIMGYFSRLNKMTGGTIMQKIKQVGIASGMGAAEEAMQEGIQTYLTNQIAKGEYDPDRDPFWGLANAMTVGGIVGTILPGIGAAISTAPESERPKLQKKALELHAFQKAVEQANSAMSEELAPDVKQQIDQAAQLTEDQIQTVQVKQEANLAQEQAEDEAKRQEKLAKEAEKESKNESEGKSVSKAGTGGDTGTGESVSPSSEYVAADSAYKKRLEELRFSPNIEIGPKGFTPNNDLGIVEAKELTELWQQRDNARIADLKTPRSREKATVKMTPGRALREQVQNFYRGVAKGVKKGSELKSQLLTKVQEAIKEHPLSPKQVSSILSRVKNTSLFTPGSVSRLNDYIGRVADDAELAEKYDQAYSLRKKIKKKKSGKDLSWQEREALKRFTAVDPDYVDLDQYLAQAQKIDDTLLKPVTERVALDTGAVNEYIASVPDTNAIKLQERQERMAENLGLTFEEAGLLLNDETNQTPAGKREAVRLELADVAEQAKNEVYDKFGDIDGATPLERQVLEGLKDIDLNQLTPEKLRSYIRTVDRIGASEDFAGSGEILATAQAQKDFKQLLEASKDWKILNLSGAEVGVDSLPLAVQAITGLPKAAAQFQSAMGLKDIGDASVEALTEEEALVEMMHKLEKKHKKAFSNDSIVRQGIYSELIRYNEDADPNEAFRQNKELIEATIENHRRVGESQQADSISKLYEPFRNALTVTDAQRIMKQVDPDGHAVMEETTKFFSKYADQVAEYNNIYFNEPTKKVINYSGPRKWISGEGIDVAADDFISNLNLDSGIPTEYKIKRPGQTSSAKQTTNQAPPNAMLNFNKHMVMANGLKKTLFDLNAVNPLLRLVENSKNPRILEVLGAREGNDESVKKARDLRNKLFGKGGVATEFIAHAANKKIPDQFDRQVTRILSPLRKFGYTLSLSGISQIPKQATVLSNVALQLGSDMNLLSIGEVLGNKEAMKEMIKGESISLRGAQKSQFSLGEVASDKQVGEFEKGVNKFLDKSFEGWLGIKPLVKTDTTVAQMTWLAFYKQYLKQNGIEYEGLKGENSKRNTPEREAARAYAKQRTDTMQVTSNPHELGKWIKNQGAGAQILKAIFIPYGSFTSNTKARLFQDWRTMTTGNKEQRASAAKDFAGTMTEAFVFQSVSAALKIYVWSLLGQGILSAFDLPEDRDREKKSWESAVRTWRTNLLFDALPLILTDPGEKLLAPLLNDAAERWMGYDKKNPLFYKYNAPEDDAVAQVGELFGPYAVPLEKWGRTAELAGDVISGTRDVKGKERELSPEQKRLASLLLTVYGLHSLGYFPADVINAIDKEYKAQKPGRRKPQY